MIKKCGIKYYYICLVAIILLGILCSGIIADSQEEAMTMTEFDMSAAARQEAAEGTVVTISTLKEFRLFQKHLNNSTDGLSGISFRQEADITPGDYRYTYDEEFDLYWIEQGEEKIGAVDRSGLFYKSNGYSVSSIEALGLSDLLLQEWDDAKWFAGNYDGQGYYFRGFLLGILDNRYGSGFGGLFCDLGGGTIRNVKVADCCMHYCMSPLVNAMYGGTIENCHVQNIVGAADCGGGIAGLLWQGTIRDCTVDHCVLQFRKGYSENAIYGGIGGVVGVLEQNTGAEIINCEVSNTTLYGADFSQVGIGGIAGVANTSRRGNISIQGCSAVVTICGGRATGGILGRVKWDGMGSVSICDCVCSGSILEDVGSSGSDIGGILGKIEQNLFQVSIENCISQMIIDKHSEKKRVTSSVGGVIGSAGGDCVIADTVFAGKIQENESAAAKGQTNYVGGIVGEMTAEGRVVNCANFASVYMGNLQNNICGGLVGLISSDKDVNVVNSINVGGIIGQTTGGLVGIVDGGEATYRLHNDLSLGETSGETTGDLAAEISGGTVSYCYQRNDISRAFGNSYPMIENCYQVSAEQLAGTETTHSIFKTGDYAGICSVREVLNQQAGLAENKRSYAKWKDTQAGYPLPESVIESLPFTPPVLDTEWKPLPSVTEKPTASPSAVETQKPTASSSAVETQKPTISPPAVETPHTLTPATKEPMVTEEQTVVAGFSGKSINNKSVILKWKKNTKAIGYRIYRSVRKSSGYREIKKCGSAATQFRDKKCKSGKKYYYQIRTIYVKDGKTCRGRASRCSVKLPYLCSPVYRLSKGKNTYGEKYLQITMRKYAGEYVDIYLKKEEGHYLKVSMASHKIAAYRGKIRFTYQRSGVNYWCKLRTYRIKKGKKQYSAYSKVKKIRL